MRSVVHVLEASIDALADVDLDALDDESLHELTVATQRLRDRFEVAAGRLLARWDHRQVWRGDQSLSGRRSSQQGARDVAPDRSEPAAAGPRHAPGPRGRRQR